MAKISTKEENGIVVSVNGLIVIDDFVLVFLRNTG